MVPPICWGDIQTKDRALFPILRPPLMGVASLETQARLVAHHRIPNAEICAVSEVLSYVRSIGLPAYGDDEVAFMSSVMERHRPTHVFDWGTNVGASARLFYDAARIHGFPCEVHTVELPLEQAHLDRDHPGHRYGQWLIDGIHAHRGDGLTCSLWLFGQLQPERALFFLDGNHEQANVLRELEGINAADPDAVILGHDTNQLPGPALAIAEFTAARHGEYLQEVCLSDSGLTALWPRH